ncbi:MAG TPA: flagellar basal body protein, partial [Opitutaceae bacterium]|nr:flagellar basal body protein [Opitutaceae bacterium]
MNLISGIDVSASALNAQRTRLDIVAQNIANAQTTRGAEGKA